MKCAWQSYLTMLPLWIRPQMDRLAQDSLQETRFRLGKPPKLILKNGCRHLTGTITAKDIQYVINSVSQYSPWAAYTISDGYLTGKGGHRIGICGQAGNHQQGIIAPTSLNLRVARDFDGIAQSAASIQGSILLIGPPCSGKTTFLRDLIRLKSDSFHQCISVIDEKQEIFPQVNDIFCFPTGENTDVMSGCSKAFGIDAVLRNMGPSLIAVDEITNPEDCKALLQAGWCGVDLLATVHASSLKDLASKPIFKPLVDTELFHNFIILKPDKSWRLERI